MMIRTLFLLCLIYVIIPFKNLEASHFSGGDITTRCVGIDQVEITVKLFWDCDAFATMPSSVFMDLSSACGGTQTYILPLINANGTEISNLCPNDLQNSTCNGGTFPGRKEYIYQDVINVSSGCDPYVASYYDCCRNFTNNVPGSSFSGIYLETLFNVSVKACNQPPVFNNGAIPYFCVNQAVSFNYGATEPEGDSLVYSFVDGMEDVGLPLTYGNAYSGAEPIQGITIDPATGQMDFVPGSIGNFIVVVRVEEYDKNTGLLLSVINRDVEFVVISCNNNLPDNVNSGIITNLSPNAILSGTNSVMVCEGESIFFDLDFLDPDVTDTLSLSSDMSSVLPGVILDTTGINPLHANIKWTVPSGSGGKDFNFTISVIDNGCPVQGVQVFSYQIHVIDKVNAGPDQTICLNSKAALRASGGSVFTWKSISGDPITTANFSCNSCSDPKASPSVTTTYEVSSNLVGACKTKDTVMVTVVPDFTYTLTKSTSNSCLTQDIQLDVKVLPSGAYTYSWTGNGAFSDATAANTKVSFNESGNNFAYVNILSPGGCIKRDSISVNVYTLLPPDFTLSVSDSVICSGDSISLTAVLNSEYPAGCGLSLVSCNASAIDTFQVGNDTKKNTSSSYPAPYGNYSKTGRQQFLFLASELRAAGIKSKIGSLSFFVSQNTGNTVYDDFTIRMTCTAMNAYNTANWEGGLMDVVFPRQIILQNGWNQHMFDSEYEWDGISNLVVEVCFDNTSSAKSFNAISPYTVTPFPSVLYYTSNVNKACSFIGTATISNNRPNILFTACSDAPASSNYNYTWNAPLSAPALPSVKIAPYATAIYSITVSDKNNLCKTVESVQVRTMKPLLSFNASPDSGMAPLLVNFNNTSAPDVNAFSWKFGDGNTSTAENPSNTYIVPGKYTVSMIGTNTDGCVDTISSDVIVKNKIPNIITPNGDNLNDVFSLKIENLKSYNARILNRWGASVYEWTDPNGFWSADKAAAGVYYYVVEGIQNDGSPIKFHGALEVVK
jgi:hypothetical protein